MICSICSPYLFRPYIQSFYTAYWYVPYIRLSVYRRKRYFANFSHLDRF
nr:MAG TPA: hypothetical protein [Bacteriophage sp.]